MAVNIDLTQGDEKAHLIRMTLPMIGGLIAIMSMNLADTFFVGQLGTDQLAAMGFTFPVVMVMNSLAFGVGTGASSVIARAIGRQDTEWVKSYSTQAIIIALAIALVFAIVGLSTTDALFHWLGAPEPLLPLIHDYMDVWYWGSFLIVVPMVGNAGIRATGNTRLPSTIMIVVAVINLILDPIFIFGWFGMPRLELQGAALTTVVSYSIACLVSLYILKVKLKVLTWDTEWSRLVKSWRDILAVGIPAAGTNLIAPLSSAVTTWLVAQQGTHAVAGYSVGSRIEAFSLIVIMALSSIIAPFAGQNWGARKIERLQRALGLSFRFSLVWGGVLTIVLWLGAEPLAKLFTADPLAIESATRFLHLVPITFGAVGIMMMVSSTSNGVGRPIVGLILSLARLVVVYLPLAWILAQELKWGLEGIYLAIAFSNAVVGLGAWWWSSQFCKTHTQLAYSPHP
ncbi:MAG: MATE family efflux transporter [Thiofilum sp.]|uniref:MATE family efflux transporter n=1 Tax=Thiofilum sp. TaxID=2212733 RepID=UPI0025CE52DB|nr:MATE family efflux transporter [Thiofilum sp.]MBK8454882.1 MATE family efflux transporter [Thiofilum sp.]